MHWNILSPLKKIDRKIHKLPPQGYSDGSQFICSLCCSLRPKLYLGRTPTITNLPLPKTHKFISTKNLFSTGWQNPSQNCSGLAKQGIPLQSHGPCPSKDVQNDFLAPLDGLESSQRIACYTKIQSPFVSAHSLDTYSLPQLPLQSKVFGAEIILFSFHNIWPAESCVMAQGSCFHCCSMITSPSLSQIINRAKQNKQKKTHPKPKTSTKKPKHLYNCSQKWISHVYFN